jgi:hypothetical protein
VPSFDANEDGTNTIVYDGTTITALTEPRLQQPQNATIELSFAFIGYKLAKNVDVFIKGSRSKVAERQCKLYYAMYDIYLQFDNSSQAIT